MYHAVKQSRIVIVVMQILSFSATGEALAMLHAELSKAQSELERQRAMALKGAQDHDMAIEARQATQSQSS